MATSPPAAPGPPPDAAVSGLPPDTAVTGVAGSTAVADVDTTCSPVPGVETWKRHSILPLPVAFYTPETRWAGGAAAFHAYRGSAEGRPTVSGGSFVYTQNRQISAEFATDGYLADGLYGVSAELVYSKFPDRFYGIGNDTRAVDEETYTARGSRAELGLRRLVRPGLYLGASYEFRDAAILDTEDGRMLAGGTVPGSEGGAVSGAGMSVTFDTRDNVLNPTTGSHHVVSAVRFGAPFGGDFEMARYTVGLRHYIPVRQGHVLGLHGSLRSTTGDVPFNLLPVLGGQSIMRGTFGGRYRDRHLVAAQAEYRLHVWRRLGVVGFAGAGQVADRLGAISLADLHPSLGYGLRIMLDRQERANLRIDFGHGGNGASGMYITVGEAF